MASLGEALGYFVWGNPLSQIVINTTKGLAQATGISRATPSSVPPMRIPELWQLTGGHYNFIRLAGLSGAAAIIMSAYGKAQLASIPDTREQAEARDIFASANRYHFFHTCALLTMPLAHYPLMTGSLLTSGILLFSGSMYCRAFTGNKSFTRLATYGGFCLIAAWLTLLF